MAETIGKSELAELAGVAHPAVSQALRRELGAALTPNRKRLYRDHPATVAFIEGSTLAKKRRERPPRKRSTPRNGGKPAALPAEDPFTYAARMATLQPLGVKADQPHTPEAPAQRSRKPISAARALPVWVDCSPAAREQHTAQYLYDVERGIAGQFPEGVDDLGAMSMREVADRFGTLSLLSELVKALKNYADMQNKEAITAKRRGDLIPRTVISGTIMPLVNLAFSRLVTEAPGALGEQVIARVLSGSSDSTGDLRLDVEALIRTEVSGILQDCRDRIAKEVSYLDR